VPRIFAPTVRKIRIAIRTCLLLLHKNSPSQDPHARVQSARHGPTPPPTPGLQTSRQSCSCSPARLGDRNILRTIQWATARDVRFWNLLFRREQRPSFVANIGKGNMHNYGVNLVRVKHFENV